MPEPVSLDQCRSSFSKVLYPSKNTSQHLSLFVLHTLRYRRDNVSIQWPQSPADSRHRDRRHRCPPTPCQPPRRSTQTRLATCARLWATTPKMVARVYWRGDRCIPLRVSILSFISRNTMTYQYWPNPCAKLLRSSLCRCFHHKRRLERTPRHCI